MPNAPAGSPPADGPSASPAVPLQPSSDNGITCGRCGTRTDPPAGKCAHCGSFLVANQEATKTGLYRRCQPVEIREAAEALVSGIISDRGGETELSALEKAYVQSIGDVTVMLKLLVNDLGANGLFTPAGAPRKSYDAYLAGVASFDRLAQRIGLDRRARQVTTLAEVMLDGR